MARQAIEQPTFQRRPELFVTHTGGYSVGIQTSPVCGDFFDTSN